MPRKQQILLVDADPDHRATLRATLSGLTYPIVGEANYGVEASRMAVELHPDIVVVHIEEPLALAFRTLETVQRSAPRATPVVISQRGDGDTARKAMLAGARGFIVPQTERGEIDRVLQTAFERHQHVLRPEGVDSQHTAGVVITVFSPKGGVGKSTLATNLAIGLRKHTGSGVAIVDLDCYFGDVAVMMGADAELTLNDVIQARRQSSNVHPKDYLTPHPSGVDILAAPHSAEVGTQVTTDDASAIVSALAASYDFVVVDTAGAFSPLVATALDEATIVLMVTSADIASIKDARLSIDMLRDAGFDNDRLKLVVNHATNAQSVSDADLARTVSYDVFWSVPHDKAAAVSTQLGAPLLLSNPKAKMAQQIDLLSAHLTRGDGGHALETPRRLAMPALFSRGR